MGHYRQGKSAQVIAPTGPPVLTISYDSDSTVLSWTWTGTDPSSWQFVSCGNIDVFEDGTFVAVGSDRSASGLNDNGDIWLVGTDDDGQAITVFSNCVQTNTP